MGCFRLTEDSYKGKNTTMRKSNNRDMIDYKKLAEEIRKQENEGKNGVSIWEIVKRIGSIFAVASSIIIATLYFTDKFGDISEKITGLQNQIDALQTQIDNLNIDGIEGQLTEIYSYLYNDDGVKDQLGMINAALNIKVIHVTDDDTVSVLENVTVVSNGVSHTTAAIEKDMHVGVDSSGHVYIAEELIGETILLTYQDEGKDVFFLGQYTEELRWDGYCITNAYYPDGTLYGICEMHYKNGTRLDYKTMVRNGDSKSNAWGYYSRICDGMVNYGVSEEYSMEYVKQRNFTNTNVRISDFILVNDFVEKQEKIITKYYRGNTVDRRFHDDSGEAVYVKFDVDGTVRSLYKGCFVNGKFQDNTGNAWNIVYWDEAGYYVCNRGIFVENHSLTSSTEKMIPESMQGEIDALKIPFELRWKKP